MKLIQNSVLEKKGASLGIWPPQRYIKRKILKGRKLLTVVVLLGPTMALLLGFTLYPFIYNIGLSLFYFPLYASWDIRFVGLENYVEILSDPFFWKSIEATAIITSGALIIEFLIGLGIALVLNEEFRGRGILRTLFIIPLGVMPVVSGLVWKLMLFPGGSLINDILSKIGVVKTSLDFWGNPFLSRVSIMAADIWTWTPFMGLILLAGLQAMPGELYDAAQVDGASQFQRFLYITLPLLKHAIIIAALFRTMDLLRIFDTVYMMTKGGPGEATEVISFFIYRNTFKAFAVGGGAALSLMVFALIFLISHFVIRKAGL